MPQRAISSLITLCISLMALAFCSTLRAADEAKLELGLGVAGISFPDYRGSAEQQSYLLPLPYIVYRGERFRADRDGIRGLLFEHPRLALDISMSGSVPVNSEDNPLRQGMADLDPTFELGPSLNFNLTDRGARGPRLLLPVRTVISVGDGGVEQVGWRVHPKYELPFAGRPAGFDMKMQLGPQFADGDYHDRFYSVSAADARAERPTYAAGSGYSGFSLLFSATRRYSRDWWLGAFLRYDDLGGAVFEDSPLVVEKRAVLLGIGLARVFYRSGSASSAGR